MVFIICARRCVLAVIFWAMVVSQLTLPIHMGVNSDAIKMCENTEFMNKSSGGARDLIQ